MQPRLLRHIRCCSRRTSGSGYDVGKTHKGVLNAFSDRLVKNGPLPKELGRLLKHAETFRYVADYEGDNVELSDAREMVEQAETFVAAMQAEFMPDDDRSDQKTRS